MEFKSLKNIESSFRQIRLFGIVFLVVCLAITGYSVWSAYSFAEAQRQKIYVLDGGKSLMLALSQDLSQVDSVSCNFDTYPYKVNTYARQMIIRESNVTERSLVTRCNLLNSVRSDNNPHGFTIEAFEIIENRDIKVQKR